MAIVVRRFRQWWQIPRNIRDRPQHRQVTFLELFYDLVYVVLISELTHALAQHVDLEHVANFAFLFMIVWWAWLNGTTYHELHGNNDIRTRVFTFLQMFCVAAMAIFAHDALGETSTGFAIAFAAFQLILIFLWWRTGVHDPNHRALSRPYSATFLINTLLFAGSVFVEPPLRFGMWALATLIAILLPVYTFSLGRNNPAIQTQIDLSLTATPSFIERMGLFTIIVLGEVIVGVVQGVAGHHDLDGEVIVIGGLGMLLAIGLWWVYFDYVSHRKPRAGTRWMSIWMYAHLPVTAGIASIGAAILNVIEQAGEQLPVDVRWLLVCAIAVTLVGIAGLIETIDAPTVDRRTQRIGALAMVLAAAMIAAMGFSNLQTIPLLVVIALLLLAPVFLGLLSWLRSLEAPMGETGPATDEMRSP
ncbi:MAG: low temperature requirement protein A [Anaerolineae bacterium]|nr:low temperature requirement protein A [Anaerolineae bacterium]